MTVANFGIFCVPRVTVNRCVCGGGVGGGGGGRCSLIKPKPTTAEYVI